jgi:hypothetical protein
MSIGSKARVAVMMLAATFGTPGPVSAQGVIPSIHSSGDPNVIKSQLQRAVTLGREVLAGLQETSTDDSVPLDPGMIKKAGETYALIRAGRHGFELNKERNEGKKFALPDPVMDLAFKRVDVAWNLSRCPLDFLNSPGVSRPDYLQRCTERLGTAIRLVNEALVLMP